MPESNILDLQALVRDGRLFRPPCDGLRVDAFIPPAGRENHAANMVELANGDLLCAWFAGTREGMGDVRIALARLPAGSAQWSQPVWASEDLTRSEQNPVLFAAPDGRVWLFYTAQEVRGCSAEEWKRRVTAGQAEGEYTMQWTAVVRRRISADNGHTWGPVEVFSSQPGSFCRQPMLVMTNGEWLFPMYYSLPGYAHGDDYTIVWISADQGRTWQEHVIPQSRGRVQATVVETEPGRLVAFFRSRAADRIYISRSPDYGRTWTAPERTALPNNNSSIQAHKLASGRIALIFNPYAANEDPTRTVRTPVRYPVTIALSEDGGATWPYMRHVDTGDDLAGEQNLRLNRRLGYPCIIQTRDGMIHVGYSYRDRQCIKYVRVSEDWILGQRECVYGP